MHVYGSRERVAVSDQIPCAGSTARWSYKAIFTLSPSQSGGGITHITLATRRLVELGA